MLAAPACRFTREHRRIPDTGGSIDPRVPCRGRSSRYAIASGFLLAVALGLNVSCGIALASSLDWGWHRTAAIGVFGATAAAGKLIGLMPEQIPAAFDIAYSHAVGNRQYAS